MTRFAKPVTPTPLDTLWQARVIMWVVLAGEGLALVLTLAPGVDRDRFIYFALTSMVIQWVSLLALGGLYLLRRPLRRLQAHYVAYTVLGLLVASTWLVTGSVWLLLRGVWPMAGGGWQTLFLQFTGITLAVGLLGLAAFQNHWRARQLAVLAKQSELEALQARIRPHFLFNTLNTGAALIRQRPGDAEQLLLDLADLFRAALAGPREIALQDELDLVRRYLEIESLRFGERLLVEWRLPGTIPPVDTPALSIQPLVENAIRHGVEPRPAGGTIEIEVAAGPGVVRITVRNPMPAENSRSNIGHQVGLNSVRARVDALTHGRGRVETSAADGVYTASIVLPMAD
ncbi:MAG: sensor histidine kinase [Pseudoxanthomonas sp.]